jgi:hypothetical protein
MMNEVMRLTTFFATLAVSGLFATSVALAVAGALNTSGVPLLCRDCTPVVAARVKPPNEGNSHARPAPMPVRQVI